MAGWAIGATGAMTPSEEGSGSLSLSSLSSLFHQRVFCELCRATEEAHKRYLDSAREVGRLERCLDVVRVALEALERKTTVVQAAVADIQAHIVGKSSSRLVASY